MLVVGLANVECRMSPLAGARYWPRHPYYGEVPSHVRLSASEIHYDRRYSCGIVASNQDQHHRSVPGRESRRRVYISSHMKPVGDWTPRWRPLRGASCGLVQDQYAGLGLHSKTTMKDDSFSHILLYLNGLTNLIFNLHAKDIHDFFNRR